MIIFESDREKLGHEWVCVEVGPSGGPPKNPDDPMSFVSASGERHQKVSKAIMTLDDAIATMGAGIRAVHISAIKRVVGDERPLRRERESMKSRMIHLGCKEPAICLVCGRRYWFTGSPSKAIACSATCRKIAKEILHQRELARVHRERVKRQEAAAAVPIPDYSANRGRGGWVGDGVVVKAGRRLSGPYQPMPDDDCVED